MKTSSINQIPMYESEDAFQYGAQMKALVKAIDPRIPARFANLSAANAAYGAFVADGGALTDGMQRSIAGEPQIYARGQWRGIVATTAGQTTFFATTINDGTEAGIAIAAVPDPGWPYILDVSAVVAVSAQADTYVNVRVRLDSVSGTVVSQDAVRSGKLPAGEAMMVPLASFATGTLTGSHNLIVTARRTLGSGNWNVISTGSLVAATVRPSYA